MGCYCFVDCDAVLDARRAGSAAGAIYSRVYGQNPNYLAHCYANSYTSQVVKDAYDQAFRAGIERDIHEKRTEAENLTQFSL